MKESILWTEFAFSESPDYSTTNDPSSYYDLITVCSAYCGQGIHVYVEKRLTNNVFEYFYVCFTDQGSLSLGKKLSTNLVPKHYKMITLKVYR